MTYHVLKPGRDRERGVTGSPAGLECAFCGRRGSVIGRGHEARLGRRRAACCTPEHARAMERHWSYHEQPRRGNR